MKLYFIEDYVIEKYIRKIKNKNSKKDQLTKSILKRKFTAKILATKKSRIKLNTNKEVYLYNFAGFNMVVDEEGRRVVDIFWDDPKNHKNIYEVKTPIGSYKRICKQLGLDKKVDKVKNKSEEILIA